MEHNKKNGLVICHKEIRPYGTTPSFYYRERQLFGVFRPYFLEENSQAVAIDSEFCCTELAMGL